MNSIRRLGLIVALLATVTLVAGVFAVQGYMGAQQAQQTAAQTAGQAASDPTGAGAPETIYVNPAPSPQVIHVQQTATPAANPPVIHVVVPGPGGGDDGGSDD